MVWCGDGREKELNGQLGVFGRACVHVCVRVCVCICLRGNTMLLLRDLMAYIEAGYVKKKKKYTAVLQKESTSC